MVNKSHVMMCYYKKSNQIKKFELTFLVFIKKSLYISTNLNTVMSKPLFPNPLDLQIGPI